MPTATLIREPELKTKVEERAPVVERREIPVAPIAGELPGMAYVPGEVLSDFVGPAILMLVVLAIAAAVLVAANLPIDLTQGGIFYPPMIP